MCTIIANDPRDNWCYHVYTFLSIGLLLDLIADPVEIGRVVPLFLFTDYFTPFLHSKHRLSVIYPVPFLIAVQLNLAVLTLM